MGNSTIQIHQGNFRCEKHGIQFTRGRPYKKNDNAHIEQKNWTHVRRVLGWDRYDTHEELDAINALYRGELRVMMNLFQPCVKLLRKERIGTKVRRYYDEAKTPIDRLLVASPTTPALTKLLGQRDTTDPFTLSQRIGLVKK